MTDFVDNFIYAIVSTGYDDSATSIVLNAGHGFSDPASVGAYDVIWYNNTSYPNVFDDDNKEIVRVTALSTNIITITRAQQDTSATTKNNNGCTYKMIMSPTKKTITDLQAEIDSDISTHATLTTSHGTTGDIVGESNSQTLTNKKYKLDESPDNLSGNGIIINGTVGENVTIGDVLYLKAVDGKYWKADADQTSTLPALVISLATIAADGSGELMLQGIVRYDTWSFTVSGELYVSCTPGSPTQTAPSADGDLIQKLGIALETNVIYFKPELTITEIEL